MRAVALLHICWRTSTVATLCLSCHAVTRAAPLHLISWSDLSLLLCLQTVQFLEGAGGNKPHYIAVCFGTALPSRARETLAAVLLGCLSLWSASQCESTDPTCPDRCTYSSGFLCESVCLSISLPVSVPSFCSCIRLPCLCPPPGAQHNLSLSFTGSTIW